ncbi:MULTISPECIES: D-hexose-6-phosphate mutarotase [Tenebrionibacter/Tenebrionicola group]|uniref:Putative glucose-6-phosphate 1-epimerase n=2 Tax=Tenebrionibacter/Tenebrionicola group TaxID=2969848 RepID=A0A8K0XVK0_9ENTR|nr:MULTISPECIES: D-hexose-6-phosphate mutarotase [Tenebrionibacter/Tenebrionicola group]MBK4714210.1 D-hexose-6-phosphate mutarotase [Tenebrionibacter intestinalis]MBV4413363.1 D-hexose-6-phosphate mutarotase [Tenebrionicola larvae]MBV5094247.1 D-hexose-6-phosphate mutarotase [Tenebrionicola larvae]
MIATIFTLPEQEILTPSLTRRQMGELDILVVNHPAVRAAVALQGAHLLAWKPQEQEEVLWLSDKTAFARGKAIRGGVPLCWPWFGPAAQEGLPAHGFVRNLPWKLDAYQETDEGVELTLTLKSSDDTLRQWPHAFTLYARFSLAKTCNIALEAHGDFETTCALHSYFNVGNINDVKVSGLGKRYVDKVAGGEGELADGVQTFPDRTDRIYLAPEARSLIHDARLHRVIEVAHRHHSNVVGWNPGPALSASMGDMPDDGYQTFVCVETAAINTPQRARPQAPSCLSVTLRVVE